jgi:hypothetical protein
MLPHHDAVGGYVTILYDRSKKMKHPMMVIPMRMAEEVYCSNQSSRAFTIKDADSHSGRLIM